MSSELVAKSVTEATIGAPLADIDDRMGLHHDGQRVSGLLEESHRGRRF